MRSACCRRPPGSWACLFSSPTGVDTERSAHLVCSIWPCFLDPFRAKRGRAVMGTTGAAMVSSIGFLISLYCAASAGCDLAGYDHTPPTALRGGVSNPLADFEYASDVDIVGHRPRIWNYVLNRRTDRGVGITWARRKLGFQHGDRSRQERLLARFRQPTMSSSTMMPRSPTELPTKSNKRKFL